MLTTLIESKSRREQSAAQVLVSVAAHTAVIGAALYATASARPSAIPRARSIEIPMVYHSAPLKTTASAVRPQRTTVNFPARSWSVITRAIAVDIPSIEAAAPTFDPGSLAGTALADPPHGNGLRETAVVYNGEATFIISAEGRYEAGSLRFVRSDNALFERAVESALVRMRFVPAEIGGRKVRQLVEMPFVFTLQR
jgi:protein TonB